MSSTMEAELLGAARSDAGHQTDPGPNEAALDVSLLGGQLLSFRDLEIPIDQFADFGQLGALSSISEASSPLDGHAASGVLGPDGGLSLDSAEAAWGTTTIDLLSFSDALGLGGLSDLAVDELDLELGAMGSEVIAEDGVFLDPDGGGTGPGQYIAGDASLFTHSPLIEDAAAQISDLGGQVDTTIEAIVTDNFDTAALAAALGTSGGPALECNPDSELQGSIVDAVVGAPITSANQVVTIDFSTGSVAIHLEHLVDGSDPWAGGDDAGLNGLGPNTELIDVSTYPQVAEGVDDIIQEATVLMSTAAAASLSAVTVTCEWYQEGPLPGDVVDVTWGPISLGDGADGTFPPVETNCSGPTAPADCAQLVTSIDTGGALVTPIFGTAYDFLVSEEGRATYELLITDILTGLVTETIGSALSPVFDGLTNFLSLQVNHQEITTCTTSDGTEVLASVEVSALSLLFTGVEGRIGLGNSGVRVDACAVAEIVPVLEVDPSEVFPGDTLEVAGSGYTPESTVSILLYDSDGNPIGASIRVSSDELGRFILPAVIQDDTIPGEYTIVGTDDTTGTPAETALTVRATNTPSITADPSEVPVGGAATTVTGEDFTPAGAVSLSLIDADGNMLGESESFSASDDGTFETVLDVPADAPVGGDYTILAVDEESDQEATTAFTIVDGPGGEVCSDPALTVPAEEIMPGAEVLVTGAGFPTGVEVAVQLTGPDGEPVGDPVMSTPDEDCAFEVTLTMPDDANPGSWTITATPEDGSPGAEASITVGTPEQEPRTLEAWFQFDTVEQGGQQTFSASGFDRGEMVSATIHSTPISLTAQAADADGVVSWTFTVPRNFDTGWHQGVATSTEQGDDASASFQVTAAEDTGAGDGGLAETGSDAGNLAALSLLLLGAGAVLICRRQILTRRSLN